MGYRIVLTLDKVPLGVCVVCYATNPRRAVAEKRNRCTVQSGRSPLSTAGRERKLSTPNSSPLEVYAYRSRLSSFLGSCAYTRSHWPCRAVALMNIKIFFSDLLLPLVVWGQQQPQHRSSSTSGKIEEGAPCTACTGDE